MFGWLKKIVGTSGSESPSKGSPSEGDRPSPHDTLKMVTPWQVADRFLENNPTPTPFGVRALIQAGASQLLDAADLFKACEKIQEHGYQYPLNPILLKEVAESELLEFLRWHEANEIEDEYYANEATIRELITKFRTEHA